jgi:hypothetical protein
MALEHRRSRCAFREDWVYLVDGLTFFTTSQPASD